MTIPGLCQATAIGSFPHCSPEDAIRLILETIPRIPVWPQLPAHHNESMIIQYNEGMPGLVWRNNKLFFDTASPDFESGLMSFYESYLQALEMEAMPLDHRFGISPECSRGLYALLSALTRHKPALTAIKGQITGPVTLATSLKDQDGRNAYFDNRLREVVVKTLAMKARWQIHQFRFLEVPVIIFIDEPSLAAYGSTAFLGISERDVINDLQEIIEVIHAEGGLAGIHCCENTDWGILVKAGCDILNFDAYSFFEKVVLYAASVQEFLAHGKVLAWGLIPTGNPEDIAGETPDSLVQRWKGYIEVLSQKGIEPETAVRQALITPACGTGSLMPDVSQRVMRLLKDVSERLREEYLSS